MNLEMKLTTRIAIALVLTSIAFLSFVITNLF